MHHVSVTYSPIARKWQAMVDGAQDRRVIYTGNKTDALIHGIWESKALGQKLFLFDRDGLNPRQILP